MEEQEEKQEQEEKKVKPTATDRPDSAALAAAARRSPEDREEHFSWKAGDLILVSVPPGWRPRTSEVGSVPPGTVQSTTPPASQPAGTIPTFVPWVPAAPKSLPHTIEVEGQRATLKDGRWQSEHPELLERLNTLQEWFAGSKYAGAPARVIVKEAAERLRGTIVEE